MSLDKSNWLAFSISFSPLSNKVSPISSHSEMKFSLAATKSVSQFTSYITATFPFVIALAIPSVAIALAFLAALAIPFSLNHCDALSKSSLHSFNALIASLTPACVIFRNCFTNSIFMFNIISEIYKYIYF
jgi:hypothetical protein